MKTIQEQTKLKDFLPSLTAFVQGFKILYNKSENGEIKFPGITGHIRITNVKNLDDQEKENLEKLGFKWCDKEKEWIY